MAAALATPTIAVAFEGVAAVHTGVVPHFRDRVPNRFSEYFTHIYRGGALFRMAWRISA